MAKPKSTTKKIKVVNDPDHPGRGIITGVGTSAKPGDVVELDRWTANHLIAAGIAQEVK